MPLLLVPSNVVKQLGDGHCITSLHLSTALCVVLRTSQFHYKKLDLYGLEELRFEQWTVSDSIIEVLQKFDILWSSSVGATAVAILRAVHSTLINFEYWSLIITTNRYPDFPSIADRVCRWPHTLRVQR